MGIDKGLLETAADNILTGNPNDHKGGPGRYNGAPNLPARTSSPNAMPEKTYEETDVPKGKG